MTRVRRGWPTLAVGLLALAALGLAALLAVGAGKGAPDGVPDRAPDRAASSAAAHAGDVEVPHSSLGGATGSATLEGKPLIASNGDNPWETRTRLLVVAPEEGYRFIGTQIVSPPDRRSPWSDMITRGMNERGLAYTWTYVAPRTEPTSSDAEGLTFEAFGRRLLAEAATVDEAIRFVEAHPRAYHGNFLFADAGGTLALLEISTESYEVALRTRDGVAYRANHWLTPRMQEIRGPPSEMSDSGWRQARLHGLFTSNEGQITEQSLMRIFSDTHGAIEHGWSIESHRVPPGGGPSRSGTTSSDVASPRDLIFWYAYGWGSGTAPRQPEAKGMQDRSWGVYLPFHLPDLEPGEYSTVEGRLTPLAVRYLARRSGLGLPTMELPPVQGQEPGLWERTR